MTSTPERVGGGQSCGRRSSGRARTGRSACLQYESSCRRNNHVFWGRNTLAYLATAHV